ncbi:MAG: sugar transferase [Gloeobacteraceae cyanobacterium ES-bin-316]|nr:sugar transferase [Ferruginibacter sp.]
MRAIDIIVSLVAILSLVPLFILIAIAIKIETRGPVFYSSLRAGRGFKVFSFYKFRTMIINADKIIDNLSSLNIYATGAAQPHFFKIKDDPRITRVGTFLRNSSLDELPQLFNVLLGDMSIVGNRPLPLYEATTLTTNEWSERFMAPAGITGLWQISKRGQAEMRNEERILLDINYARYRTLKGDLKILIKTPSALIQKANV